MAEDSTFGVELVTPEAALLAGAATAVICRTSDGDLTVLDGHTDLVGDVVAGLVRIVRGDATDAYCVHGGFIQVRTARGAAEGLLDGVDHETRSTRVTILAGVAESVASLDVPRAQAAQSAAAAALAALPAEDANEDQAAARQQAAAALARATLRLECAGVSVAQ
jgi:F-type H+-transporting ATPase subunit epsilon